MQFQDSANVGLPMQHPDPINWSASEYISHEKSVKWFLMFFGASALVVLLMFLVTRDILSSVIVLIAAAIMSVYANRPPATKKYIMSEDGLKVDQQNYSYAQFKSFSIVEEGGVDSIWLKPLSRYTPMLVIYFSPEDEQRIIDMLANFLPFEQRELDPIDRLLRYLRF